MSCVFKVAIFSLPIYKLYDIHNISNSRNTIYFLNVYFQVDRLRRPNNARVPWVFEIIALNTSDATRIQSRFYVCYLTYQKLLSVWSFKYKATVVVRIM